MYYWTRTFCVIMTLKQRVTFCKNPLAACNKHERPDLEMYFTVNLAFIDYLEQLNDTLTIPINRNWTNIKQPIPISLDSFQISSKLVNVPMMLHGALP